MDREINEAWHATKDLKDIEPEYKKNQTLAQQELNFADDQSLICDDEQLYKLTLNNMWKYKSTIIWLTSWKIQVLEFTYLGSIFHIQ